jgi:hypothetical protein
MAIAMGFGGFVLSAMAQDAGKKDSKAPAAKGAPSDAAGTTKASPPAKAAPKSDAAAPSAPKPAEAKSPDKPEPAEPSEAAPAPPAAPVSYKEDMTAEDLKVVADKVKREKTRSNVQKWLGAQAFGAGEEAQFDAYYRQFALPRWTVAENYGLLIDYRKELRNDLLRGRTGPPYDRLLDLTFNYMSRISGPAYYPAVRYNAMIVLGDLNAQEFSPGARGTVEPYPPAQKMLLQAVTNSDSDAVRVAALVGLMRHANLGIADPQVRDGQFIPALLALAQSGPPKDKSRSAEGHAWLRAMAIDVLAALRAPGPDGSVVTAMVAMVSDKDTPLITRLAAARALGSLDLKGFKTLAPSQLAAPLGHLAVELCTAELARARAPAKSAVKSGYPGMAEGGYSEAPGMAAPMPPMYGTPSAKPSGAKAKKKERAGSSSSSATPVESSGSMMYSGVGPGQRAEDSEEEERLTRLRRNLKSYLNAVRLGLNGPIDPRNGGIRLLAAKHNEDPKAMAGSEDKDWQFVDNVFGSVRLQIATLDNDKVEEFEKIREDLVAARNKLREYLKGGPPPMPPGKTPAKGTVLPAAKK